MKTVSASEIKVHLGKYLAEVNSEPITIMRMDRPAAVLISTDEYERLEALDDAYWAEKASEAESAGYATARETAALYKRMKGKA